MTFVKFTLLGHFRFTLYDVMGWDPRVEFLWSQPTKQVPRVLLWPMVMVYGAN